MRIRIHTSDFHKIEVGTRFGLYVIKSNGKRKELIRVGCSGVSSRNKGDKGLKDRLNQHAKEAPKEPKDPNKRNNPTQRNQPWEAVWLCELLWPDNLILENKIKLTKLSEQTLFGT